MSVVARTPTTIPKGFWVEHDRELRMYIHNGLTSSATAKLLGITRGAITRRACRIKMRWKGPDCIGLWQRRILLNEKLANKIADNSEYEQWLAHKQYFPPRGYCVFPHGDPGSEQFMFCGEKVEQEGMSYCTQHRKLSYYRTNRAA